MTIGPLVIDTMKTAVATLFLSSIFQTGAIAEIKTHPCIAGPEHTSTISVVDRRKQTFQLSGSQKNFSLTGLEALKPSSKIEVGNSITIYGQDQKADRYGVIHIQAFQDAQKKWLQGAFLRNGKALLNGSSENISSRCLATMRKAEHQAIASKVGLWSQKEAILTANQIDQLTNRIGFFSIIEGKVLSVGNRKRRLYLNFGQNWSQDFTLSVVKKGKGAFKGSLDLLTGLKGKTVRVRGVLEQRQGPLIRLFDEAQIEIIDR